MYVALVICLCCAFGVVLSVYVFNSWCACGCVVSVVCYVCSGCVVAVFLGVFVCVVSVAGRCCVCVCVRVVSVFACVLCVLC